MSIEVLRRIAAVDARLRAEVEREARVRSARRRLWWRRPLLGRVEREELAQWEAGVSARAGGVHGG